MPLLADLGNQLILDFHRSLLGFAESLKKIEFTMASLVIYPLSGKNTHSAPQTLCMPQFLNFHEMTLTPYKPAITVPALVAFSNSMRLLGLNCRRIVLSVAFIVRERTYYFVWSIYWHEVIFIQPKSSFFGICLDHHGAVASRWLLAVGITFTKP